MIDSGYTITLQIIIKKNLAVLKDFVGCEIRI